MTAFTKTDLPYVSVVVPAYNEHFNIANCIEALLAQDYPADQLEIIIVDNNSTDDTADIVRKYPVTLLHERDIQTPAASRNRGIRHAQGEIVAFTDADCIPEPDWLSHMVAPFSDPQVVGVAGVLIPTAGEGLISEFMAAAKPMRNEEFEGVWYVITANLACRREALLAAGLFQPRLFTAEDIDMGFRLQINGYGRIVGAPQGVVKHPFANTWEELWERFRRYGYSEILLDAMYTHQTFYMRTPQKQFMIILRQFGALFSYLFSFIYRSVRSVILGWDTRYVSWPLLWFAAEGNNLLGKLRGLIETRFLTRKPRGAEQVIQS